MARRYPRRHKPSPIRLQHDPMLIRKRPAWGKPWFKKPKKKKRAYGLPPEAHKRHAEEMSFFATEMARKAAEQVREGDCPEALKSLLAARGSAAAAIAHVASGATTSNPPHAVRDVEQAKRIFDQYCVRPARRR